MSRAIFILVTGFWLTMNVLLWQTQFGSRKNEGAVPVKTVWEKILTAADDSSLTVFHRGKLVGACHLRTAVGEEWSKVSDENVPTGPLAKAPGYRLSLDGSAIVPELTNRLRFEGELMLDKKRQWRDLSARFTMRPVTWEVHSAVAEGTLRVKMQNGAEANNIVLRFSDLKNPAALAAKFLGPFATEMVAEAGLPLVPRNDPATDMGINWDAHDDSIRIGHTSVQVYRLHTHLVDRYEITAIVSRAGEILRVELPNDFVLVNDRLAAGAESSPKLDRPARNPL